MTIKVTNSKQLMSSDNNPLNLKNFKKNNMDIYRQLRLKIKKHGTRTNVVNLLLTIDQTIES